MSLGAKMELSNADRIGKNATNFFDKFLKSNNRYLDELGKTRMEIDNNDMLVEKGFFAFLNDLLKSLRANKEIELNNLQ